MKARWPTVGRSQKPGLIGPGLFLGDSPAMLGRCGSFCATFRGDGLGHFTHKEGLRVRFATGPLQADNGVSGLARNKVALSVGAGYFKLADLAL